MATNEVIDALKKTEQLRIEFVANVSHELRTPLTSIKGYAETLLQDLLEGKKADAEFVKINRGGDITYHGPGQLVVYPILDLNRLFTDVHKYVRFLEEVVIQVCEYYSIDAGRIEGFTGVWVDRYSKRPRKICAIGVRTSRWVTMHGFAFNVNSNLNYFANIIPCGIEDKAVTSLEKELGAKQNMSEVKAKVKEHLGALFGMEFGVVNYEL